MHVKLLDYSTGQRQVKATITVTASGRVKATGTVSPKVWREMLQLRTAHPDGESFLRALPQAYSGTYLRAEFHEGDA